MILLKDAIQKEYELGGIWIDKFDPTLLNPNSYTTILSNKLLLVRPKYSYFDTKNLEFDVEEILLDEEGYILQPNNLYLGCSTAEIGSDHYVPMYEGRSTLARIGLQSHLTAGFGDIGFSRSWTKEIQVIHPVKIYPNMPIGQVYFIAGADVDRLGPNYMALATEVRPANSYQTSGQYHSQDGPTLAKKVYR